jgi:hypothetical protein
MFSKIQTRTRPEYDAQREYLEKAKTIFHREREKKLSI